MPHFGTLIYITTRPCPKVPAGAPIFYIGTATGVFIRMNRMIGKDFETRLASPQGDRGVMMPPR